MSATSASRGADALADPVREARADQPANRFGEREDRLGQRRQAVARGSEQLALAKAVLKRAREDLGDGRCGCRNALHEADR